jgi:hypothetical protein
MRPLLRHLRANAVAYLALSIALGGTSYAAASLPRNSVGTTQLKNNAVTSAKVKNRSLTTSDFSSAAVRALSGETGPAGATGAQGPAGAKGDRGADGANGTGGAKGDRGDPGVGLTGSGRGVAGAFLSATDADLADLANSGGGGGTGVLTLPANARIYISASVDVANSSTTAPSRASCTARISAAGSTTLTGDAGPSALADLHQVDAGSSAGTFVYGSLSVSGSVVVPDAGTYNAGVDCIKAGGGGNVQVNSAAINVIAVPAQ